MDSELYYQQLSSTTQSSQLVTLTDKQIQKLKAEHSRKLIQETLNWLKIKNWKQARQKCEQLFRLNMHTFLPQEQHLFEEIYFAWVQNKEKIFLLELLDCFVSKINTKEYRDKCAEIVMGITLNMLKFTIQIHQKCEYDQKFQRSWQAYLQILRSFTHASLQKGLDQLNWFYFDMLIALQFKNCTCKSEEQAMINTKAIKKGKQIYYWFLKLLKQDPNISQIINCTIFHQICLLFRIFITNLNTFLNRNNAILIKSSQIKQLNSCNLVMKLITSQLQSKLTHPLSPTHFKKPQQKTNYQILNKLDCLIILIAILQTQIRICQNMNQILYFILYIIQYIYEEDNKQISLIKIYCTQLFALLCYRNIELVVQHCRKEKTLKKMYKMYKDGFKYIIQKLKQNEENLAIIMKRLILGLFGVLKMQKMETQSINFVKEMFPILIQSIQIQHGFESQETEGDSISKRQSTNRILLQQWQQQYEIKHKNMNFQNIDEISQLKLAVSALKDHNPEVFAQVMQNFDENQMIMWMVELEQKGNLDDEFQ